MFYFDKDDARVLFIDKREETHELRDKSSAGGFRKLEIRPDLIADFTALPFRDETFALVVFDPPHLKNNGSTGWLAKKYGKLPDDWRTELRKGFAECFRVLRPEGTLIFKWNENDIALNEILALTEHKPLLGNKYGKNFNSHWVVFFKEGE
jgi:SAM-dependent methyltransferase